MAKRAGVVFGFVTKGIAMKKLADYMQLH